MDTSTFNNFLIRACGVIFLLRLIIQNFFPENYIYSSERLSDLIVACLILMLALIFTLRKCLLHEKFPQSCFDFPIYLLLAASCLSFLHTADFSVSMNFFIPFVSYIFLFYIVMDILKSQKDFTKLWSYILIGIVVVIFFGFWEYTFLKDPQQTIGVPSSFLKRIGSVFHLPNVLAGFLMLFIPLLWTNLVLTNTLKYKKLISLLLILCLITFLLTFSFMCTINFILTTILLSPLIIKNWFHKNTKAPFIAITLGIILFLIVILIVRNNFSTVARWEYLKTAKLLIENSPWIGSGLNTFDIVNRKFITYKLGFSAYVHNSYLQWWVETGLLGFISGLLLVWTFAKNASKAFTHEKTLQQRIILIGLIWSLSAFFVDNLSNFTMLRPDIALFWWVILAGFCAIIKYNAPPIRSSLADQWHKMILVLIIIALLFLSVRISLGLINYNKGMILSGKRQLTQALDYFKRANALDPTEFRYPSAKGSIHIQQFILSNNKILLEEAEQDFLQAARLSPQSHKTFFILSNIAFKRGDEQKAQEYLDQARKLSPLTYKNLPSIKHL